MRAALVHPRLSAMVLVWGMLLAAALMLAGGLEVSQAVQAETAQGSDTKTTVLADGVQGMRKPLEP